MWALTSNTTGHVSSNAVQQSKIASFFMTILLNSAGQGPPSRPAGGGQGLFLGPDYQCETARSHRALPSEAGWPCPTCLLGMAPGLCCPPNCVQELLGKMQADVG